MIPCEKLCAYYEYVLQEKGICRTEQDCAGYDCVAENTTAGCPPGQLFANEKTCVNIQDCLCTDYNGNPVKVCVLRQFYPKGLKFFIHLSRVK